ncbi:Serine/threonine kinase [Ascosphaera aggregata]|nr:Serine/threonine kinase [Ascosphaera aggregata]
MEGDDDLMAQVAHKIEREKALIAAAKNMRHSTTNPLVLQRVDANIRDGSKNIAYLEEKMRELQLRRRRGSAGDSSDYAAPKDLQPPNPSYSDTSQPSTKPRQNFSKLDLIKWDTPYLGPKIQLMVSQLAFKLDIEKQYKEGIEKMMKLYQYDGDRKSRSDTHYKRIESNQKIQLLKQALKRYEDLHVDLDTNVQHDDQSLNAPNIRKPLTGILTVRVHAIQDVDHAPSSRFSRGPESFIVLKVENDERAKTRAVRGDRWTDETFNIEIREANEVELTVYDKPSSSDRPVPIGMLWVRISDIVEEMRRKKIETEINTTGWVSADHMDGGHSPTRGDAPFGATGAGMNTGSNGRPGSGIPPKPIQTGLGQNATVMIDSWFALEPVGRIHLTMSFAKQLKERRPIDFGLNRQGAVRQKKEEIHEKQGHKFVTQQFYNIMRCALCGELLKYAAGMQCADCKYTCHKKCYPKVVTKCISKANYETDPDEEKINHRIPHRFETFANISANWCCHCGYLLPFGRKNAKKCTECSLTCHSQCVHLVPDFCGMSMEAANQILEAIHMNKHRPTAPTYPGREQRTAPRPSSAIYDKKPSIDTSTVASTASSATASTQPRKEVPTPTTPTAEAAAAAIAASSRRPSGATTTSQDSTHYQAAHQGGYAAAAAAAATAAPPSAAHAAAAAAVAAAPAATQPINQSPTSPHQYQPQPGAAAHAAGAAHQQQQQVANVPPKAAVPAQQPPQAAKPRVWLDHFNFLAVLGKGNFGKVMLAETKTTKHLYAIKVLKKEFIIEHDEVESIKSEKRVFLIANKERHPFLLNLHACFQTETRVYFVMEYVSGGDLMLHIQRGQFGLKRAQFYAAEVCLALKYFHENGVIYRDLKLDNILLSLDGHIKIADYGLCKEEMWYGCTTGTFCGTPEFMAPEILLDKKYGRAVDWWAFGVLIYQMLLQQSPFRGEDEDEIYDAILSDDPLYPIQMPRDSVSILQKLLTREPERRLGSGPTDAQEIMSHAFFRNINWDDIYHKRVPPPVIPTISSATDTSNFDTEFTSVTPVLTPVNTVLTTTMQEEFRGFSYFGDMQ